MFSQRIIWNGSVGTGATVRWRFRIATTSMRLGRVT